jgi:hypothetical protein
MGSLHQARQNFGPRARFCILPHPSFDAGPTTASNHDFGVHQLELRLKRSILTNNSLFKQPDHPAQKDRSSGANHNMPVPFEALLPYAIIVAV